MTVFDREGIGYVIGFEHHKDSFIRNHDVVDYPPLTYCTDPFCAHLFIDIESACSFMVDNGLSNRTDVSIWSSEHWYGSPTKLLHKRTFGDMVRIIKINNLKSKMIWTQK